MQSTSFCRSALLALRQRAQNHAEAFPPLHHMLVLPPDETIRLPKLGAHPLGDRKIPIVSEFAGEKVATFLPPSSCWPAGLKPVRAIVADKDFLPYRHAAQEPYRVHLFFGHKAGMSSFFDLAADLIALRPDIHAALNPKKSHSDPLISLSVIYADSIHGQKAQIVDAWLCTVHWWAWKVTDSPIYVKPRVVFAGSTIEAAFTDPAVEQKLSLSYIPTDVFTLSAVTIDTLLRFFEEPPEDYYAATYPVPSPSEREPAPDERKNGAEGVKSSEPQASDSGLSQSKKPPAPERNTTGSPPGTGKKSLPGPAPAMTRAAAHKLALEHVRQHGWPESQRKLAEAVKVSRPLLDDLPGIERYKKQPTAKPASKAEQEKAGVVRDGHADADPGAGLAYDEEKEKVRGIMDEKQRKVFDRLDESFQVEIVKGWEEWSPEKRKEILEKCSDQAADKAEAERPGYIKRRPRV